MKKTGEEVFADARIRYGNALLVADDVLRGKGERSALVEIDFPVSESLDAEFGAFGIEEDGEGNVLFLPHLFYHCDFFRVILVRAVGNPASCPAMPGLSSSYLKHSATA